MKLAKTTWIKIKKYLKTKQTLIIPVDSTKQNGPIALTNTDFIAVFMIAKKIGNTISALFAPPLHYKIANYLTTTITKKFKKFDHV